MINIFYSTNYLKKLTAILPPINSISPIANLMTKILIVTSKRKQDQSNKNFIKQPRNI